MRKHEDDDGSVFGIVASLIGMVFGVGIYWLYTTPYLPGFFPAMAHLFYVAGMAIFTILIGIGYILCFKKSYILLFTAFWLITVGMWIMFAYNIYGVINSFLLWWGSNLSIHTGLIMWILAVLCLVIWLSITAYDIGKTIRNSMVKQE